MATIKDEIVAIATEQGYEGDAPQTIAEAVNALGSVMGGGGSGGAEPFVVTFTNAGSTYSADKTFAEIVEAATAGKQVVGIYRSAFPNGTLGSCRTMTVYLDTNADGSSSEGYARFSCCDVSNNGVTYQSFYYPERSAITTSYKYVPFS
jgi:hypothetical protein